MFRSPSEIVERLSHPGTMVLLSVGLLVGVLLIFADKQSYESKYIHHKAAHVRGYVRKLGYIYEYGIKTVDSNVRQRLGFKRSLPDAEDTIHMIMLSNSENPPVKSS